ncbi:MAG TPA: hypothetical protein VFY67_00955 [Pyrinomonadaceae bacterium]|nr:hypothetical protein [Pyrinomonadaceae bacterium]
MRPERAQDDDVELLRAIAAKHGAAHHTPGAKVTDFKGMDSAAGATAKLAYDQSGHAMLMANKLPTVPQGLKGCCAHRFHLLTLFRDQLISAKLTHYEQGEEPTTTSR